MLHLAGHDICLGRPSASDGVVVWGQNPSSRRGRCIAQRRRAAVVTVEDAFLRSLRPGRMGDPPLGLLIDPFGVHYDAASPSLLENILISQDLTNPNLLARSEAGIARIKHLDLSKYNLHDPMLNPPEPGYVLVIDQTQGDASLRASGANIRTFQAMLARAKADHPGARILLKVHPETSLNLRQGHFQPGDATGNVRLFSEPVSPHRLLAGAIDVYTVSSQLGFEAIVAGHKPHVFGTPFYAGWGLTHDVIACPRRTKSLTAPQLFAAAMILAPIWYDPCRDRLCSFEDVLDQLEAETRSYLENRFGHVALGMSIWKRRHLQSFFGREKPLQFAKTNEQATQLALKSGRSVLVWAGKEKYPLATSTPVFRVEDGFLRSRGLGANLVPPLSLIADDMGIYYDPTRPSRFETVVTSPLPPGGADRAERLIKAVVEGRATKYNTGQRALPDLPKGHRILVPGQVEDDASILHGTRDIRTNLALLQATRAANPVAVLIYKPHPDVEAGLRAGAVSPDELAGLADAVLFNADAAACIEACDEVWTMTSTLGFEALLRGKPVTCLGMPFYAGWGLTRDLYPVPARRLAIAKAGSQLAKIDFTRLVHAALITYPRYIDPISHLPCPPEVAADRLINGPTPRPGIAHRWLAKLQGRFAGLAFLWR